MYDFKAYGNSIANAFCQYNAHKNAPAGTAVAPYNPSNFRYLKLSMKHLQSRAFSAGRLQKILESTTPSCYYNGASVSTSSLVGKTHPDTHHSQ